MKDDSTGVFTYHVKRFNAFRGIINFLTCLWVSRCTSLRHFGASIT